MNVAWNANAITATIMMAVANCLKNDCAAKRNSLLPKFHCSSLVKATPVERARRYLPYLKNNSEVTMARRVFTNRRVAGNEQGMNFTAVLYALASAALFGISTPVAKMLLGSVHPGILAGLLYCGAGLGVTLLRWARRSVLGSSNAQEAALTRSELPWLAGAIVA